MGDSVWKDGLEFRHALCPASFLQIEALAKPVPGLGRPPAYMVIVRNYSKGRIDFDPAIWHLDWTDKKGNQKHELSENPDRFRFDSAPAIGRTTLFAGQSATGYVYFKQPNVKEVMLSVQVRSENGDVTVASIPVSTEAYRL